MFIQSLIEGIGVEHSNYCAKSLCFFQLLWDHKPNHSSTPRRCWWSLCGNASNSRGGSWSSLASGLPRHGWPMMFNQMVFGSATIKHIDWYLKEIISLCFPHQVLLLILQQDSTSILLWCLARLSILRTDPAKTVWSKSKIMSGSQHSRSYDPCQESCKGNSSANKTSWRHGFHGDNRNCFNHICG